MNPFNNPELYEKIVISGLPSPGTCTLTGWKRSVDWDVKQGGGIDGASTTRKGKAPASGTVSLYLVDFPGLPSQLEQWRRFSALLQEAQDKGKALDVYHPDLADLKVTDVVVTEIGQLEHDGKGGQHVSFGLMEYRPPKPKPAAKPKAGSPVHNWVAGQANNANELLLQALKTAPSPNAAAEAELAELKKQAMNADNL